MEIKRSAYSPTEFSRSRMDCSRWFTGLPGNPVRLLSSKVAKSRAPTTISRGARPVVAKEMTVRAMWTNLRRRFGMAMLASVGRAPAKPGHVKGTSRILVNARRGMTNYVMSLASIRSGNLPTASLPALVERRLNGPSLQPIGKIPERPLKLGRSRVSRVHAIAHGCRSLSAASSVVSIIARTAMWNSSPA